MVHAHSVLPLENDRLLSIYLVDSYPDNFDLFYEQQQKKDNPEGDEAEEAEADEKGMVANSTTLT